MTRQADQANISVRKTGTVRASRERAFTVFTSGFSTWWPASQHLGEAGLAEAVIEPAAGGRFYERWPEILAGYAAAI